MGSKTSRKQKRSRQAQKPTRRKFFSVLVIFICAAIVGLGGWLFYHESGKRNDPEPKASKAQGASREAAQTFSADNFQNLVGRWVRPDGGYIIEIRNVDSSGLLQAAYFNPRPINVSQARLTFENKEPQVFIELRDVDTRGQPIH
jgi:hypothetical protein